MDIYSNWLPEKWYYAVHLFLWFLPIIFFQWLGYWKILWRNRKPILLVPLFLGSYLIFTDIIAVHFGIWYFVEDLILGISPLGVPIEEWCFFYLTSLLVTQSFILFLPEKERL